MGFLSKSKSKSYKDSHSSQSYYCNNPTCPDGNYRHEAPGKQLCVYCTIHHLNHLLTDPATMVHPSNDKVLRERNDLLARLDRHEREKLASQSTRVVFHPNNTSSSLSKGTSFSNKAASAGFSGETPRPSADSTVTDHRARAVHDDPRGKATPSDSSAYTSTSYLGSPASYDAQTRRSSTNQHRRWPTAAAYQTSAQQAPRSSAYLQPRDKTYDVPDAATHPRQHTPGQPRQRLHDVQQTLTSQHRPTFQRRTDGPYQRHREEQPQPERPISETQLSNLIPVSDSFNVAAPSDPRMPRLPPPVATHNISGYSYHHHVSLARSLPRKQIYGEAYRQDAVSSTHDETEGRISNASNRHRSIMSTASGLQILDGNGNSTPIRRSTSGDNEWQYVVDDA